MRWIKGNRIFVPSGELEWMHSHASLPIPVQLDADRLRIFFGARDTDGRSQVGFVDVSAVDPSRILDVATQPLLPLGRLGTFDDRGVMPSWIVQDAGRQLLYYIGWNVGTTVPYHVAIGLAIDDGEGFRKHADGPVRDRSTAEPFFNTTPCVLRDGNVWRMWYSSCTGWEVVAGRPEPRYRVLHTMSRDGVDWAQPGTVCIDYDAQTHAIARPCVLKGPDGYRMFYSFRSIDGYRSDPGSGYRLGYAESDDGIAWIRRDADVGIAPSDSGWDSGMIEYCHVYQAEGLTYLLYNGDGFGRSGFGYAVMADD